jgi:hypothetical protein
MMDDRPEWFAPRRYGYGAGLPVAWQGWAVLAGFLAIVVATGLLLEGKPALQATILFPALAVLTIVTAKTTRGGWRWRWGEKD